MAALGLTPTLLYKTAVFFNAVSIPGHILLGLKTVHPTLNTIQTPSPAGNSKTAARNLAGKRSAQACFNYINGSLFIAGKPHMYKHPHVWSVTVVLALLNWQWARTGGPKSKEEQLLLWTLFINGLIDGATYISGNLYSPLGCMWVAPMCSVAAYLIS
jgi:hypothetical protein